MVFSWKILPEVNKSFMNQSLNIDDVIVSADKSRKCLIDSKSGLLCRLFTSGFGRPDTADVNVNRKRSVTAVVTVNRKQPDTAVATIMTLTEKVLRCSEDDYFGAWIIGLIHCGLITPCSDIDVGQYWLSKWHAAWGHQAIHYLK